MKSVITFFLICLQCLLFSQNFIGVKSESIDSVEALSSSNKARLDTLSTNVIRVTSKEQLLGDLSSTAVYILMADIDMGLDSIVVPGNSLNIRGLGFGIGSLSATNTLFASPPDSSGNLFITELEIKNTGKVFNLVDKTGNNAVEMLTVNFNDCSSLGTLDNYRQGLESNTGRFGGSPTLTLKGNWNGGYRVTTSITRGVTNSIQYKAGAGLLLNSRFLTDINYVVPNVNNVFCDFSPSNIFNDNDFQIKGAEFGGLTDISDYFPNMPRSSPKAIYLSNSGILNSRVGGKWEVTSEVTTPMVQGDTINILGGKLFTNLIHFDTTTNELRYVANKSKSFILLGSVTFEGTAGDEINLIISVDRASGGSEVVYSSLKAVDNFIQIGFDKVEFFILSEFELNQNDVIRLKGVNRSSGDGITMKISSFAVVKSL